MTDKTVDTLINREQLIHDVGVKYKVFLSEDDSIFHYLFMHDVILEQYRVLLRDDYLKVNRLQFQQAKALGEQLSSKTVNALNQTGNRQRELLQEVFDKAVVGLQEQNNAHFQRMKGLLWWMGISAGAFVLAVAGLAVLLLG